ncbi:unnamed protein product, partial [Rotaria magnacalcarata]
VRGHLQKLLDGIEVLPHPAYSPDLAPSDYGLFRSMVHFFRGRRFETFHQVEAACREFFESKESHWYRDHIRQLAERWRKFDVLSKVLQMDSLDHNSKLSPITAIHTFPWQYDLQLNLETWRQVAKDNDNQRILLSQKPLKLNTEYLQTYVEKAKEYLKKRSQHESLLRCTPFM